MPPPLLAPPRPQPLPQWLEHRLARRTHHGPEAETVTASFDATTAVPIARAGGHPAPEPSPAIVERTEELQSAEVAREPTLEMATLGFIPPREATARFRRVPPFPAYVPPPQATRDGAAYGHPGYLIAGGALPSTVVSNRAVHDVSRHGRPSQVRSPGRSLRPHMAMRVVPWALAALAFVTIGAVRGLQVRGLETNIHGAVCAFRDSIFVAAKR